MYLSNFYSRLEALSLFEINVSLKNEWISDFLGFDHHFQSSIWVNKKGYSKIFTWDVLWVKDELVVNQICPSLIHQGKPHA